MIWELVLLILAIESMETAPAAAPKKHNVCWRRVSPGCVNESDIRKFFNHAIDQCKQQCSNNINCKSFEYATAASRDGGGRSYEAGDCVLHSSTDIIQCNGSMVGVDVYIPISCNLPHGEGPRTGEGSGRSLEDTVKGYGWYDHNGQKYDMYFDRFVIDRKGEIQGSGTDNNGHFNIKGKVNQSNQQVTFQKQYGRYAVGYIGQLQNGKITGDWKLGRSTGTFMLNVPLLPGTIRPEESICTDIKRDCQQLKKYCTDPKARYVMVPKCRLTCGICRRVRVVEVSCVEMNIVYTGNDIYNVSNVRTHSDCMEHCKMSLKCKYWSLKTNDECWLKTNDGGRKVEKGTVSGPKNCKEHVHVNNEDGSDVYNCGTASAPCKTLRMAITQVSDLGTLYILGNQYIDGTIDITKSMISICGTGNKRPSLFRYGGASWEYAFQTSGSTNVRLTSLKIYGIGILDVKQRGMVLLNITDSLLMNANDIITFSDAGQLSIVIKDSVFNNTGEIRFQLVPKVQRIEMVNSVFYKTDGFWCFQTDRHTDIYIKLTACNFIDSKYFDITLNVQDESSTADISHTVFKNTRFRLVTVYTIKISYCNFLHNSPVLLESSRTLNVKNVVCIKNLQYYGGCMSMKNVKVISIRRSEFKNNFANVKGGAISAEEYWSINIMECTFFDNQAQEGGALHLGVNIIHNSGAKVQVHRCNFIKNMAKSRGGAIFLRTTVLSYNTIANCTFYKCSSDSAGGAMAIFTDQFELINIILKNNHAKTGAGGVHAIGKNTISRENNDKQTDSGSFHQLRFIQCSPPSIFISLPMIIVTNTTFVSNDDTATTHVRLEGESITMQSIGTKITYPKTPYSNIEQNVISAISSTSMELSDGLSFTCSPNFNVEVHANITKQDMRGEFQVKCATCNPNMYTLTNQLYFQNISATKNIPKCRHCPPGAVCKGEIKVLDNYWGEKGVDNELTLIPCPQGYCCSTQTTPCVSYNTCNKGRTGTLCGTCDDNHVQNYVTDGCIPKGNTQCNLHIFILYLVIVSQMYTIILTFVPAVVEGMKKIASRCKKTKPETEEIVDVEIDDGKVEESDLEVNCIVDIAEDEPAPIAAVVTQVIFYFQIASLVHIDVLQQTTGSNNQESGNTMETIFNLFNFRFSVYRKVCSMEDLSFVIKMFISLTLKMSTIINLLWFFMLWKCCTFLKCRKHTRETETAMIELTSLCINENQVGQSSSEDIPRVSSFVSVLKIGFVKLVKFNFTSSVMVLFHLVHCERISDQLHLYMYGDHVCYSWWQYLIFIILLPVLALFPLSFGMALDLLKRRLISTNMFILGCAMPPITFCFFVKWRRGLLTEKEFEDDENLCIQKILNLEEELFKSTKSGIRWPVIQLYRNLFVVLLDTFILNHIYKSQWFSAVFVAFFAHDWYRIPFKHSYLNKLQGLTSACLFLVNLCSIPSSFSSVGDIMAVPNMEMCLRILYYFEMALYIIVPMSFPIWKLWMRLKNRANKAKKDS